MTQQTINYLLRLAIADRDQHAQRMIEAGEENCPAWGEASAAVKELLDLQTNTATFSQRAAEIGRKGGAAKHPRKGFGSLTPERRAEIAKKAAAARWAKPSISSVPTLPAVVAE